MAKNLLKAVTNNLGYKVLAVILATILWLVVYNINDPSKTRTFTVKVVTENETILTEAGKCYEVLEGTDTVTFTATAKRSIIDKLEDNDFKAVADFRNLYTDTDGASGSVRIDISCIKNNSSIKYAMKTKFLKISMEDLVTKQYVVKPAIVGTVADGYALGDVTVSNPNVLKVSGPASEVERIASVVATIDVDNMSQDISANVVPVLYDAEGKEIVSSKLQKSNDMVTITAKILGIKEVPVAVQVSGTAPEGYRVKSIVVNPDKVKIKGTSRNLNPITQIEIPDTIINVGEATSDITTTVDISEYLPEGVSLVDNADATVAVTVEIEKYTTETFEVLSENLSVNGLDDGYKLEFQEASIHVKIGGMESDLEALKQATIRGTIDCSRLSKGVHQVKVVLSIDGDLYTYEDAVISVKLTTIEEPVEPEDPVEPEEPTDPVEPEEPVEPETTMYFRMKRM